MKGTIVPATDSSEAPHPGISAANPPLSAGYIVKPLLSRGFAVFGGIGGAKRGVNY